jgi:signal transduction histidine kinase
MADSTDALDAASALDELETADVEETNRRLRAAYAEIAALAGGLAHEIRNPLSTMQMNLGLLAEDFARPESDRDRRALRKIDRVKKECHRLQGILEDFLRFVRVQDVRALPADLNAVVEEVRDFCEGEGLAQGVISRAGFDPDLPPVSLDVDLFKQALFNLIRNAQLAMPGGGELILRTRREGDRAVLDVIDTGVGIPPGMQDEVFDAFVSTRPGGSGLGLPTTRKIVEAHGGTIGLESEPGRGTKFTIRLPLA